jgi:hypothetical protein
LLAKNPYERLISLSFFITRSWFTHILPQLTDERVLGLWPGDSTNQIDYKARLIASQDFRKISSLSELTEKEQI